MTFPSYARSVSPKQTPQSEPIPGKVMVQNEAGGYSFALDDWGRLDRFLVLGSEGGSYYASERKMTVENAQCVQRCLAADYARTINRIVEISEGGRAPKNDPAIFALALCASVGSAEAKALAFARMPRVCRIGTHLFMFAEFCNTLRGWGRGLRKAIGNWYTSKVGDAGQLAYQVAKYQQRNGWSHRDLLRLSHVKQTSDQDVNTILHWCVKGWDGVGEEPHSSDALRVIWAMERAKKVDEKEVVKLILEHNLPRECIPTEHLKSAAVWEALLAKMPLTAMIRNLATMTRVGLLAPMSNAVIEVNRKLGDVEYLRKSRVHPIAVLSALKTYAQGHGERGTNSWVPVSQVIDALDAAFYASFGNVESTGKRWLFGLDVSGSMDGGLIAGVPGLTPRIATAAMALVTAAVEPNYTFLAFSSNGYSYSDRGVTPLSLSPRQRLDDVIRVMQAVPFGGTDCALPMIYAYQNRINVDAFVVLTDSETWAGAMHPTQALQQYRNAMGIPAKLIVVGMTSNGFTIADPNDAGMLDVAGFDTATPQIMADFVKG